MENKIVKTKRGNPHNGFVQNFAIGDDEKEKRLRIAYKIGKKCNTIQKRYTNENKMDIWHWMHSWHMMDSWH